MEGVNIILVVLDTLRKDSLYDNIEFLPNLRELLKDSVKYENAHSTAPWTVPSHASIFTGLYPSEHHMDYNIDDEEFIKNIAELRVSNSPLPKVIERMGYSTFGISSNSFISKDSAFGELFQDFCSLGPFETRRQYLKRISIKYGVSLSDSSFDTAKKLGIYESLRFLLEMFDMKRRMYNSGFPFDKGGGKIIQEMMSRLPHEPFFLYVNFMEAHEPHCKTLNPFELIRTDNRLMKLFLRHNLLGDLNWKPYFDSNLLRVKKGIRFSLDLIDSNIGKMIRFLKQSKIYEKTLLIITSDHGQSLGENSFFGHSYFLHDEITNIPLIIKYPYGNKAGRLEYSLTSLLDMSLFIKENASGVNFLYPSREVIFAESYGMYLAAWNNLLGKYSKLSPPQIRKRVWKGNNSLTVNGSRGSFEEITLGDCNISRQDRKAITNDLLEEMEIFTGQEEFHLPKSL